MKVALVQSEAVWENPEASFARLSPLVERAAAAGARLVALPEMFACGFTMDSRRVAEPPDGPSVRFLEDQARRHGVWLAGSLPEQPAGQALPFNSLCLVGPDGRTHRYRKRHPFSFAGEDRHYAAGDERVTVEVEGVRVTPFVCYDLRFADEFWETAPQTDAYLVVANWPEARHEHWACLLRARAIENQAYVVGVNRAGEGGGLRYLGGSRVMDPMGSVVAEAGAGVEVVVAEIDPARVSAVRGEFPFLRDRR